MLHGGRCRPGGSSWTDLDCTGVVGRGVSRDGFGRHDCARGGRSRGEKFSPYNNIIHIIYAYMSMSRRWCMFGWGVKREGDEDEKKK